MMGRLVPSWRPAPAPPRAKTLRRSELPFRGGEGPRRLHPERRLARESGAKVLDMFARELSISDAQIAESFKNESDRFGAEVRSGAAVITAGEEAGLLPARLFFAANLERLHAVVTRELAQDDIGAADALRLGLALGHINLLRALLVAT